MTWVAVGTSAAIGAGIGGASAAIQGEDILTGALLGGTTGALTGGAGAALGSTTSTIGTELGKEAASQLAPELLSQAAPELLSQAAPELLSQAAPELLSQAAPELLSQVAPAGIEQITPEMINAVNQGSADAIAAQGTGMQSAGINNIGYTPSAAPPPPASGPFVQSSTGLNVLPGEAGTAGITSVTPPPPTPGPFVESSTGLNVLPGEAGTAPANNGFMQGFTQFAKDNPFLTGAGIYTLASTTGMLNQKGQQQPEEEENYGGPRLSADFKGGPYSKPNVYEEKRYNYASGGITGAYQSGGSVEPMGPQGGLMAAGNGYGYPMNKNPETIPNLEAAYGMASGGIARYAGGGIGGMGGWFLRTLQESNKNSKDPTVRNFISFTNKAPSEYTNEDDIARYRHRMASGGITSIPRYYRGDLATSSGRRGDVYSATQRFLDMYDPQSRYTPPKGAENPDVGIFRDTSAATRNKSALDAAMTRQAALEKQNYIDTGAKLPRASRSAGQLNMKPQGKKAEKDDEYEYAASGGIMGASLGGYAAGGNPRLLKGPGDGMSDNIPAVIGSRQPARLADGEFVVPADVVSHLGNGSTEAGAKKLHGMMDNVRKARTGKKRQAPAVKAKKYLPK
jgi:hypothetical protein